MQAIMTKFRGFNDTLVPLLFSLLIHFIFIYIIFFPGGGANNGKSFQLNVSDKLDSVDLFQFLLIHVVEVGDMRKKRLHNCLISFLSGRAAGNESKHDCQQA